MAGSLWVPTSCPFSAAHLHYLHRPLPVKPNDARKSEARSRQRSDPVRRQPYPHNPQSLLAHGERCTPGTSFEGPGLSIGVCAPYCVPDCQHWPHPEVKNSCSQHRRVCRPGLRQNYYGPCRPLHWTSTHDGQQLELQQREPKNVELYSPEFLRRGGRRLGDLPPSWWANHLSYRRHQRLRRHGPH